MKLKRRKHVSYILICIYYQVLFLPYLARAAPKPDTSSYGAPHAPVYDSYSAPAPSHAKQQYYAPQQQYINPPDSHVHHHYYHQEPYTKHSCLDLYNHQKWKTTNETNTLAVLNFASFIYKCFKAEHNVRHLFVNIWTHGPYRELDKYR